MNYRELNEQYATLPIKEKSIIDNPILFANKLGNKIFVSFMKGFAGCNKFQSYLDELCMNNEYQKNEIANKRNNVNILFDFISVINEFDPVINSILQSITDQKSRFITAYKSNYFNNLVEYRRSINKNKIIGDIRNQLGSHLGNDNLYIKGLYKVDNDGYFTFGEAMTIDGYSFLGNNILYSTQDLVLSALNISNEGWKNTLDQIFLIAGNCVQDFQLLFHMVMKDCNVDKQLYRI